MKEFQNELFFSSRIELNEAYFICWAQKLFDKDGKGSNMHKHHRTPTIIDVGANGRDILLTMAENGGGKLIITYEGPDGEKVKAEINTNKSRNKTYRI